MSSQTPAAPSPSDAFKGILAAELAIQLGALNAFLTALQQPGANTQLVVQDFGKLQLELLGSVPQAESVGINGVAAAAQAQLNALAAHLVATPPTNEAAPVKAS